MKKSYSVLMIMIVCSFMILSCAPMHRVVRVKAIKEPDGIVRYTYGVTYNNTLIPEYTQTSAGTYANSYDDAWGSLETRREKIDPWISQKYELTNSTWFQLSNSISRLSLLALSPLVVPIEWLGEHIFPEKELGPPRSWKQVAEDFFAAQYDQPRLKATALEMSSPAEVTNL
jgi:hypothetical protein